MTTHDDRSSTPDLTAGQASGPVAAPAAFPTGPGYFFPATAPGVPLSAFAFAFAVGFLGLVDSGVLASAASSMFIGVLLGVGTLGLLVGGLWEFRAGELFGGTFGLGYAGFLLSTGLILKFFTAPIVAAAGPLAFNHAFAAWLLMWAIFTGVFAIGARTIAWAAFMPFFLAFLVLVILSIGLLGGTASWASDVTKIGGWVAIVDGLAAGYLGSAILLNTTHARDMLPLWPRQPSGARG
jgi:succinate-acetate transporter protein